MKIVISQPMFFPWVGLLEQIRLADVFVDYNDVQFSKGSFVNRVQIKTAGGQRWLTVPLQNLKLGQIISEVEISDKTDWRGTHLSLLEQAYRGTEYRNDMLAIVSRIYGGGHKTIGALAYDSMNELCEYFGLKGKRRFLKVSELSEQLTGSGTDRVLSVVNFLRGRVYITGHGARNYLDHEAFENAGVRVEYLDYKKLPYPQLHGEFTPYVSALDLVANLGRAGADYISSESVYWRDFLK